MLPDSLRTLGRAALVFLVGYLRPGDLPPFVFYPPLLLVGILIAA